MRSQDSRSAPQGAAAVDSRAVAKNTARERCELVVQAAAQAFHNVPEGRPLSVLSRHGRVEITSLTAMEDQEGTTWIEVHLAGPVAGGDPHFRIFNPPQLVEDPNGEIEHGGRRYRLDPLGAVAEAIAGNGGATRKAPR